MCGCEAFACKRGTILSFDSDSSMSLMCLMALSDVVDVHTKEAVRANS